MSLLEQLHAIENWPPSHAAVTGNVLELVGKIAAYIEHGDELLKAAEADAEARQAGEPATHVDQLVSGVEPEPDTPSTDPAATSTAGAGAPLAAPLGAPAPDAETDEERVARLRQELATAEAQLEHPTTSVEPAPGVVVAPEGTTTNLNPPEGV